MAAPGVASPSIDQSMIQDNLTKRQLLLNTAPRGRKLLGSFTGGTLGGTTRVKLFNVGIITRLILSVRVNVDIATNTATVSPKAPYNLINRVKVSDFDSTDRVNCSGFQLWMINSCRRRTAAGLNNGSKTNVLASPTVPTAVATGSELSFLIEVPLAYSDTDLRGALLAQTAVGEAYLYLDWNNLLYASGNDDAVYNGGGTVTVNSGSSITVDVYQEYLIPQTVGNQGPPFPVLDLMTVYELAGAIRSSDNLSVGSEKLLNYPNQRAVIGAYFNYMNNGVMSPATTNISRFRLIANGNNVIREYGPRDKLWDQRLAMIANADLVPGAYFELHRDQPVETALYGNVQYGITPTVVTPGNTNIEICFESFFTKGALLPGLTQG